jgi:hypothetical protein
MWHISEDGILHSYRRESLKSYVQLLKYRIKEREFSYKGLLQSENGDTLPKATCVL